MPRYNLRLGTSKITVASTSESLSSRFLERGKPQTVTDSGGTLNGYSWQGQELDRSELRKVKEIREKGGLVSWLFEAKALMKFGTGAELQSENDDLQEWLDDNFENLDLTVLDLGSDGIWYPYGLGEVVETRGGEFSHIECIEPWTMLPQTDEYGSIVRWEQETQGDREIRYYEPDEIGSIVLNKSSGRDKVGVSEVLRSEEEITQYKENQRAVNKAIEIAGFPHHIWTVGQEGRSPVDDNDLRRVRNLIDNMDGDTQFVVGPDVNHDKITPSDFAFEDVTKRDLRMLTTTVGLPMEIAGYGREGMGSGSEAALIKDMLALQNEVSRRRFEVQFIEDFVKPVVKQYSPFSEDEPINMQIAPFLDERDDVADLIQKIGDYMSNAEIRDKLDLPALEDEEMAESYRTPKEIEEAEEQPDQGGDPFGGGGGLFSDSGMSRVMQSVPDNAVSITDPSEAPEGANVIEGPGGGLYYVPSGENGSGDSNKESGTIESPNREQMREFAQEAAPPNDANEAQQLQSELFEKLGEDYGEQETIFGPTQRSEDGEMQFTMHKAFSSWESGGYWSSSTAPIWYAAQDASGRGAALPEGMDTDDEQIVTRGNYVEGVEDAVKDMIAFSQEFVANNMDGDTVTVTRGISDDLAQQAMEAKESGEPLEIDPRAMESWSTDGEAASEWGEVVLTRELEPEDVAFYGPAAIPDEFDDQEITALGRGPYQIDPDNIEVVD